MPEINLYARDGDFITKAIIEMDQPEVIVFGDRLFIFHPKEFQYREASVTVACLEEEKFFCHVPPFGPKDKCLKCGKAIDLTSGKRYCEAHAIGICGEHQVADCIHCGYNKQKER